MNLHKLIFTENACYKAGRKIVPKGIMVHSTGANNPWLKRYVGPDDGLLGENKYGNHWNQPMSRQICCHAFIGKLADGSVATYQTLPWDHRGWHGGSGKKGSVNDTHIGFEICEDDLNDAVYFGQVYKEAVELCAMLCKEYGLTEKDIICHSEGYQLGIATNHGDVMHWFPKYGKSMDTFRADVADLLGAEEKPAAVYCIQIGAYNSKAEAEALLEVLKAVGANASVVQIGNELTSGEPTPAADPQPAAVDIDAVAKDVINGKYGNGAARKAALIEKFGADTTAAIQARVNALLK